MRCEPDAHAHWTLRSDAAATSLRVDGQCSHLAHTQRAPISSEIVGTEAWTPDGNERLATRTGANRNPCRDESGGVNCVADPEPKRHAGDSVRRGNATCAVSLVPVRARHSGAPNQRPNAELTRLVGRCLGDDARRKVILRNDDVGLCASPLSTLSDGSARGFERNGRLQTTERGRCPRRRCKHYVLGPWLGRVTAMDP
jgi:hypothetical protein